MKFLNKFKWFLIGGSVVLSGTLLAINITVPQSPGKGYELQGLSTGQWIASSTMAGYWGSINATTTTATSTFQSNVLISPSGDSSYGFNAWNEFNIVDTIDSPMQMNLVNRSTGTLAGSGIFVGNKNSTNSGFTSTYYGGIFMAGSGFSLYPGLQPNDLVLVNSDGQTSIASLSSTTGAINLATGPGFTGANWDARLVNNITDGTSSFMIGTTTAAGKYPLNILSTTTPQFSLSNGIGVAQWTMRNAGGNFYLSTTTVAGTSTSTPAFSITNAGTTTIAYPTRIGALGAAKDNMLNVDCTSRVFPASVSVGGCVNIDSGTVNTGPALVVHANVNNVGTGRMVVFNQENTTVTQDMILASSSGSNVTAFNAKGFPTGKGILKIEHTGGGTGFSNASGLSIDLLNATDAQGVFIKGAVSGTGSLLNIVDSSSGALASIGSQGLITGLYSSTTNYLSAKTASTTFLFNGTQTFATSTLGCMQIGAGGTVFSTGTACGSGSGGTSAFEIATSSSLALSQIAYISQVSGRTTIASAATSTLTGTGPISISNGPFIIGASGAVVSCTAASAGVAGCITAADYSFVKSATTTFSSPLVYTLGTNAVTCPTCLASYDPFTHSSQYPQNSATTSKIAIGTTTPYYSFTVASTTGPQIALADGTAGIPQWVFRNAGGSLYIATTTAVGTATTSIPAIAFTNSQILIPDGSGSAPAIAFLDDSNNGIGSPANDVFAIYTNGLERFRIHDGTGSSGFGTTTFSQNLLTLGSSTAPQLAFSDNSVNGGIAQWTMRNAGGDLFFSTTTTVGTATTSTAALTLKATGKPGLSISSSTPFATLSVNPLAGDFSAQFAVGSSTGNNFYIDNSGHIFAPNTTSAAGAQTGYWCYDTSGQFIRDSAVCIVSALKYKKDIKPLDVGLEELMATDFVSYFKKEPLDVNDSHRQMGVIADWVAKNPKLDEMLVTRDSKGEIRGFRYEQSIAWLGKSIQELNFKVDNLIVGKVEKSAQDNWQYALIGILFAWNLYLTFRKKDE